MFWSFFLCYNQKRIIFVSIITKIMGLGSALGRFMNLTRDRDGNWIYTLSGVDGFENNKDYLKISLDNPVLMAIIALRANIYSQMRIAHVRDNGEEVKNSQYLQLLRKPNYFQSQEDFFFQEMWFKSACGTNLTYEVKPFKDPLALYNLIPEGIDFKQTNKIKKLITTNDDMKAFGEQTIAYTLDGTPHNFKIDNLIASYDLASGLKPDNFMVSPSRVEGISQVLENIYENIKSKNVNLKMSQKYLFGNKSGLDSPQIQPEDRKDIFSKLGRKSVMITNATIDAKHLVTDMKRLFLDEQFANDALTCVLAFGMSRDVLNFFSNGVSTYDNEEKAMQNYIQNMTQTDADNRMNSLSLQWGLFDKGEKLVASYSHLPVMASIHNQKIDTLKKLQEALKIGIESQTITLVEAQKMTKTLMLNLKL
jgi:hypothetical protein